MQGSFGSDSTYASLALYVSGNAVLAAAVFILLGVSKVLSSFQQPILWALISSTALREAKDAWVQFLDAELKTKSLPGFLLYICIFPCIWLLGGTASVHGTTEGTSKQGEEQDATVTPNNQSRATSGFVIGWLVRATVFYSIISKFGFGNQGSLFNLLSTAIAIACGSITLRMLRLANNRLESGDAGKSKALSPDPVGSSQDQVNPGTTRGGVFGVERKLREIIRSRLHGFVAATLILSVMVCAVFLSIFLTVQIIGESRIAAAKVDRIIRSSHEKADLGVGYEQQSVELQHSLPVHHQLGIFNFVKGYQEDAVLKLQASMPDLRELVLTKVEGYLVAHNLSHVVGDVQELFDRLVDSGPCDPETHSELMINFAASRSSVMRLTQEQKALSNMHGLQKGYLESNLSAWDEARRLSSATESRKDLALMDESLTQCYSALKQTESLVDGLNSRINTAQKSMNLAGVRLKRCEDTQADDLPDHGPDSGIQHDIFQELKNVYGSLSHAQDKYVGATTLCGVDKVSNAVGQLHEVWNLARNASASGSLSWLQEAAYLVVEPLLAVGQGLLKIATTGIGSTTTFIVSSGAGLFRFGLSVVQFAFQLMLYGTLLLYLLASDRDPLLQVLNLLPVSNENRLRARNAIGRAMGSVFSSAIKLAAFHSLFTFLTFAAFGVDMPCLSAVTSMVMALLPFVPIWVISLPAAVQVLIQGSGLSAILLVALHVGASTYVDDMVLKEIPGSVPYLTGLGIVGGMYTFNNPLQGAILGPMLLALLPVVYNLHLAFMGNDASEV